MMISIYRPSTLRLISACPLFQFAAFDVGTAPLTRWSKGQLQQRETHPQHGQPIIVEVRLILVKRDHPKEQ